MENFEQKIRCEICGGAHLAEFHQQTEDPGQGKGGADINNIESEISPEILEAVMAKAKNINELDTAYTSLTRASTFQKDWKDLLKKIFVNGLLGVNSSQEREGLFEEGGRGAVIEKNTWVKNARQKKDARIYFNIVGRSATDINDNRIFGYYSGQMPYLRKEDIEPSETIDKSEYFNSRVKSNVIGLIFDLKSYHEKLVPEGQFLEGDTSDTRVQGKTHEYRVTEPWGDVVEGKHFPYTSHGFHLSFRVAPRFFQGLIFKQVDESGEEEKDPAKLQERAKEIASLMLSEYRGREKLIVPIYDIYGNMWWPKHMTYSEVEKLAAEKRELEEGE